MPGTSIMLRCCLEGPLSSILRMSSLKVDSPGLTERWNAYGIACLFYNCQFSFSTCAQAGLTFESTMMNSSPDSKAR